MTWLLELWEFWILDRFIFPSARQLLVMASWTIRAAAVGDIPSIVRVRLTALTEEEIRGFSTPEFATFSSAEELGNAWTAENRLRDGFEVFVAAADGEIVGFIVFKVERDYGYIDNIVVS